MKPTGYLVVAICLLACGAEAATLGADAAPPRTPAAPRAPTFTRDIAPIVFSACAPCHHPGGAGPFSLLEYANVRKRARQIATVTASRFMPPWLPEPGYGTFEGERRLTEAQIDLLERWAEDGAPEGNPDALPPVPVYYQGWQLGKPDLILDMPEPYTLQASGPDVFRNFVFRVPIPSRRYVKAVEILPGNKRIVHHANLQIDRYGSARRYDAEDAEPGFSGIEVKLESRRFEPRSHFMFWKPGTVPWVEPEDMAMPLDKGSDLVLNMHLKPSGKPEPLDPKIGLYFTDRAPTRFPMLLQLERDRLLDIPPGAKRFVLTDELELPLDVELLGIYPHAHYLGRDIQGVAALPDGRKTPLIWIKNWDLNWQAVYRYAEPVHLPKGTVVSMRWTYDNSEENERNPSQPPKRVVAGNNSTDEMSHLWLQVLPRRREDRMILQEALVRQKLRKSPRDFDARVQLGAVLQAMNRTGEAIAVYREALAIKPGDATAENNLGAALLATGTTAETLEQATGHFREAVRNRADHLDARYNLGNALLLQGRAGEAAAQFRAILAANPDDADVHDRLASALIMEGRRAEAEPELQAALRIDPSHPSAHYNLGYLLAEAGRLDAAADHLRAALEVRPDDVNALSLLGAVREKQGRLDEAAALFERALALDPGNQDARWGVERVREARSRPKS